MVLVARTIISYSLIVRVLGRYTKVYILTLLRGILSRAALTTYL